MHILGIEPRISYSVGRCLIHLAICALKYGINTHNNEKMHSVGFEPTQPKLLELEPNPLDHSDKNAI